MKDISNIELTLLPKIKNTVVIKFTAGYSVNISTDEMPKGQEIIFDKKEISLESTKFADLVDQNKLGSLILYLGAYSKKNIPANKPLGFFEYQGIESINSITYYDELSDAYLVEILY